MQKMEKSNSIYLGMHSACSVRAFLLHLAKVNDLLQVKEQSTHRLSSVSTTGTKAQTHQNWARLFSITSSTSEAGGTRGWNWSYVVGRQGGAKTWLQRGSEW